MSYPLVKDLTVEAEAKLLGTVPTADSDHPDREFLAEKISARYWPTPEGWRLRSVWIEGRAVLKSGEIGKSRRCAYYGDSLGGRLGNLADAPAWAQAFAAEHTPGGESR